jgi:hypothetical protein
MNYARSVFHSCCVVPDSLMCWSSHVSDDLGVAAVVVDEGHRAGPTASDEEVDEKEDLEGVEPSKVSFVSAHRNRCCAMFLTIHCIVHFDEDLVVLRCAGL